jgi:ligand-binding sensor domain-containing protein
MQLVKQHVSIAYRARHFLFLWILCLGIHASSFAQSHDKLRFERYTIDQGLSSDRIRDITQDLLGYIWIATESGVSRYDGYEFKVYRIHVRCVHQPLVS